eukprot:TRINITY_DN708_c0_g4_i1.p1 TRINITY_DN708_c0_g4~~TRINITY_DN708_c0_g4_i1.p1  ORF type:complete len:249 (+),score=30.16 TRINITY_DN708_c0_g4_i1:73-819(+)
MSWLFPFREPNQVSLRIFCFPHAGGSVDLFRQWQSILGESKIHVIGIALPGRRHRLGDSLVTSVSEVVEAVAPAIAPYTSQPYVFFGHSLGALIAYETAYALQEAGLPLPKSIFCSSLRAPQLFSQSQLPGIYLTSDDELIARLRSMGGTPSEILDNRELMALFLPAIRADYQIIGTYEFDPNRLERLLAVPLHVLGGIDDVMTDEHYAPWQALTSQECTYTMFPGGHFYLQDNSSVVLHVRDVLGDR